MKEKCDTKSKIMMAAIKLFPDRGYEKTSMRIIAEEVGITKPALYYYFKNKDELFRAIVDYGNEFTIDKLIEVKKSDDSIENKLKSLLWIKFSLMHQNEEVKKFSGWLMTDGLRYLLKYDMEQNIIQQTELVYSIIDEAISNGDLREDLDKECFVFLLIGAANIFARRQYVFGQDLINNQKIDELIKTLITDARN